MAFELVVPKKPVPLAGEAVEFRGLSFSDITALMSSAPDEVQRVFELIDGVKKGDSDGGVTEAVANELISSLVTKFPALISVGLAIAMDDPKAADELSKAPMGFQLKAVEAVFELTVKDAGGPKKFFELLLSLMASLNPGNLTA